MAVYTRNSRQAVTVSDSNIIGTVSLSIPCMHNLEQGDHSNHRGKRAVSAPPLLAGTGFAHWDNRTLRCRASDSCIYWDMSGARSGGHFQEHATHLSWLLASSPHITSDTLIHPFPSPSTALLQAVGVCCVLLYLCHVKGLGAAAGLT